MLDISIRTTKETYKLLKDMPGMVRKGLVDAMNEVMKETVKDAKKYFGKTGRPKNITGNLRDSIKGETRTTGNNLGFVIGSDVVYARIQEEGGTIRAKGSAYLTFPIGGGFVRVKSVRLPARPYLRPAIQDNLSKIEKTLTDSVWKEFERNI